MTQHAARSTKTSGKPATRTAGKYIEIIHWKKCQPRMKDGHNAWMKLYTSLLDHDGFGGMEDSARVLLIGLWLYAARTGHYILPADPKWLHRKIPMLHDEPDLKPLLEAKDIFGHSTPFLQYCDQPQAKKPEDREFEHSKEQKEDKAAKPATRKRGTKKADKPAKMTKVQKTGTNVATRTHARSRKRREESRVEQSRTEEKRTETLHPADSGFGETKDREILTDFSRERQSTAQQDSQEQIAAQAQQSSSEPEKTVKPANPMESEAGQAQGHIVPMPAPSARGLGQPRVEQIIVEHIPAHWFDEDAETFGWQIVRALGLGVDNGSRDARSDWGAFASWWCKIKANAPPMVLAELRVIAIAKAAYLFRKGRSARKKQAVWFSIMQAELLHHGIRLPPARAAPLQHAGA